MAPQERDQPKTKPKAEEKDKIKWSKDRFDAENPADLKTLLDWAAKYKNTKKPIDDNPELARAYEQAKMQYYTDATIGPGFIEDFIGGIDPKTKKADQEVLKDTLKEAGLTEVYTKYKKDFIDANKKVQAAIKARKKDTKVEVPKFPPVPRDLLVYIKEELGLDVSDPRQAGKMNEETENAIKDYKNANWINSEVTDATQQKIRDNMLAKEKALQAQKEGPAAGGPPDASKQKQDKRKEPPLPPRDSLNR